VFNDDNRLFAIRNDAKDKSMKLIAAALAYAFVLSSAFAFAQPVRHKSGVEIHHVYRGAARVGSGILHPSSGNPNGNADGLTSLRGTGSFNYGGSSPATGCYENCAPRDRDGWPADMILD
jgi:hypothetical protein